MVDSGFRLKVRDQPLVSSPDWIEHVCHSACGAYVGVCSGDTVGVWRLEGGARLCELTHEGVAWRSCFSKDGDTRLWSVTSGGCVGAQLLSSQHVVRGSVSIIAQNIMHKI